MRNKAQNATLEQRSTPLINGTEITLGAFFVALWKRREGGRGGNGTEKRRNIAFNCVKRITLNIKDAEHLEDDRGVFSFFTLKNKPPIFADRGLCFILNNVVSLVLILLDAHIFRLKTQFCALFLSYQRRIFQLIYLLY